ncbi:unnamed protein product [Musa acuminata subsp. malaccensis]|uniref:(wild Malaysian banana) hypothetical protein n=1 Tax=Musa acuminata subsp. malaccensis TaxID=214687 RepID=A0A804I4H9_MUSAM|nr:unnamed protein product [Musa acuminata subsp. malaccensis]
MEKLFLWTSFLKFKLGELALVIAMVYLRGCSWNSACVESTGCGRRKKEACKKHHVTNTDICRP